MLILHCRSVPKPRTEKPKAKPPNGFHENRFYYRVTLCVCVLYYELMVDENRSTSVCTSQLEHDPPVALSLSLSLCL